MAAHTHHVQPQIQKFVASSALKTFAIGSIALGIIAFAIGLLRSPERAWAAYLTAFVFVTGISICGLFFVAINHITRAGWSVSIRRLSEAFTSFFPVILMGSVVLIGGVKYLYPWANPEVIAAQPMVAAKTGFLNTGFMITRVIGFALLMIYFGKKIVGNSVKQDSTKDELLTAKNLKLSVIWMPIFALSFSLFSVDLLMSLLPTWYSTIFGIYLFSGSFQASLAVLLIMMIYLKDNGYVKGYYGIDHIHDVTKYLKGFTVFWAYIAFSQYMLIWYANIPEETEYYLMRMHGGWLTVSLALIVFKFIVPFIALLPRGLKRNETHVFAVAILVILTQFLDVYWMVYPNFNNNEVVFGFYEIGLFLGFIGLFLMGLIRFFEKNNLVAISDPRMDEALHHHVSY